MHIHTVDTDELVVGVHSDVESNFTIDIHYSDFPCSPWRRDGAVEWIEKMVLGPGLYRATWSDYFTTTVSVGQEACINWTCQPLSGGPVFYWSQDYKMILAYVYLPVVQAGKCNATITP